MQKPEAPGTAAKQTHQIIRPHAVSPFKVSVKNDRIARNCSGHI
jgi:hypothetical protein